MKLRQLYFSILRNHLFKFNIFLFLIMLGGLFVSITISIKIYLIIYSILFIPSINQIDLAEYIGHFAMDELFLGLTVINIAIFAMFMVNNSSLFFLYLIFVSLFVGYLLNKFIK